MPSRPPTAIVGVPFDPVTLDQAVDTICEIVAARVPRYAVTANVDFLTQAVEDAELRRILVEAHLVFCDGTPLVWASRWLGAALPERVAGSDLVPRLMAACVPRRFRVFLLGSTGDICEQATRRLREQFPRVMIAGHYSPPFSPLHDMDHAGIRHRIQDAHPDLLLVALGCPKQEKWVAMHYAALGVPFTMGVGATLDFLAGTVKRAPQWMRRSGTEWLFRLGQEPGRLYRRYARDFRVFGRELSRELGRQMIGRVTHPEYPWSQPEFAESAEGEFAILRLPPALTASAVPSLPWGQAVRDDPKHWLLEASGVRWVDAAGLGYLLGMHKRLRMLERYAVLIAPSPAIRSALIRSRIDDLFLIANDYTCGREFARQRALGNGCSVSPCGITDLRWEGELTAANALDVFERTWQHLSESAAGAWQVDMSGIRFADSTGLAMMLRLRAEVRDLRGRLTFQGVTPALLKIARLENLDRRITEDPDSGKLPEPMPTPSAAAGARIVPPQRARPFGLAGRSAASK